MSAHHEPAKSSENEPMKYGILGEDTSSIGDKLEKYTGEVDWAYLKSHFENGALIYVDPSLVLTEVGEAFSTDDAERVKVWRGNGDIITPSEPHAAYWEESGATFRALVVSPFVLIQPTES
ncbi:MAG: DUF2288 domain-containing protein [Verrucomicrobiae bacterium]|nr:DUF2288 domain-containing protein [Verrucomicrobiae bacterium]